MSVDDAPSGAHLSDCGRYRYTLWRRWADEGPLATFLMLNPSTADAATDDPTIRKCCGFARRWGMSGIWVVNLFALRATNPFKLVSDDYGRRYALDGEVMARAVGPDNDDWLRAAFSYDTPVLAWGGMTGRVGNLIEMRLSRVHNVLTESDGAGSPMCLGTAKNGAPRHPLMLAYDTPRVPYAWPLREAP